MLTTPKNLVTTVLMNGGTAKIKHFTVGGFTIYPIYYQVLASRISLFDSVEVVYSQSYVNRARYIPGENKMIIGFQSTIPDLGKALVVHEATHAVCDMLKLSMKRGDSEAMAYIAQCQYWKANISNDRLEGNVIGDEDDLVFEAAWNIACAIQAGQSVPSTDYDKLQAALAANNSYKKHINERPAYDGI